jgi:hypothetical protein
MSIVIIQPADREAQVTIPAASLTVAHGSPLTFTFVATNSNASPSTSGGITYTIYWGDGGSSGPSASPTVNQGVGATSTPTHTYANAGRYGGRIETSTNDAQLTKGTVYFTVVVS